MSVYVGLHMATIYVRPLEQFVRSNNLVICAPPTIGKTFSARKLQAAILVVNPIVHKEVLNQLTNAEERWHGTRRYNVGSLKSHTNIQIWLYLLPGIGNLSSAVSTTLVSQDVKPDLIILVGFAGGTLPSQQGIGDIIVASSVIHYEPARVENSGTIPRFNYVYKTPLFLEQAARRLAGGLAGGESTQPNESKSTPPASELLRPAKRCLRVPPRSQNNLQSHLVYSASRWNPQESRKRFRRTGSILGSAWSYRSAWRSHQT